MKTKIHYWIHLVMNVHGTDNQHQYWSRPAVHQWSAHIDQWSAGQDVVVVVLVQHAAAASVHADLTGCVLTSTTNALSDLTVCLYLHKLYGLYGALQTCF